MFFSSLLGEIEVVGLLFFNLLRIVKDAVRCEMKACTWPSAMQSHMIFWVYLITGLLNYEIRNYFMDGNSRPLVFFLIENQAINATVNLNKYPNDNKSLSDKNFYKRMLCTHPS